jgi:hypothetical protein
MHNASGRFDQPPWWNDAVERSWLEKSWAVREWQKAREIVIVSSDHILFLKQVVDEKVMHFQTLTKEVKNKKMG